MQTRAKRYGTVNPNTFHIIPDAKIPKNWKLFLSCSENKSSLAHFYKEYLQENAQDIISPHQSIYVSGTKDNSTTNITKHVVKCPVMNLTSNHEEADTKLILHTFHAANTGAKTDTGAKTIVISSPDTDVLVLLIIHRVSIAADKIYLLTGHISNHTRRYIPIHTIFDTLSRSQLNILLQIYCITGCDTVSGFYGHGKARAFNILLKHAEILQEMKELGSSLTISSECKKASIRFICLLYGKDKTCLDTLRCEMANKNILGKKLPPTNDSFTLHLLRVVFQLLIWKQSNQPIQMLPNRLEYGYF